MPPAHDTLEVDLLRPPQPACANHQHSSGGADWEYTEIPPVTYLLTGFAIFADPSERPLRYPIICLILDFLHLSKYCKCLLDSSQQQTAKDSSQPVWLQNLFPSLEISLCTAQMRVKALCTFKQHATLMWLSHTHAQCTYNSRLSVPKTLYVMYG